MGISACVKRVGLRENCILLQGEERKTNNQQLRYNMYLLNDFFLRKLRF
jgi:hypothetical protein